MSPRMFLKLIFRRLRSQLSQLSSGDDSFLQAMILMTRNFDRSRTEGHLRRATRYVKRKARSVDWRIASLQIRHLLEVGIVGTRRCVWRASTAMDVGARREVILKLKSLIFIRRNPGCGCNRRRARRGRIAAISRINGFSALCTPRMINRVTKRDEKHNGHPESQGHKHLGHNRLPLRDWLSIFCAQ